MKKKYLPPEMDRIHLSSEDVCVVSDNEGARSVNWEEMFNDDGSVKEQDF